MPDQDTIAQLLKQKRQEIDEKQGALTDLRAKLRKAEDNIDAFTRQGLMEKTKGKDARKELADLSGKIASAQKELAGAKAQLITTLNQALPENVALQNFIQHFSDRTPILLLPIRIETKFMEIEGGQHQLWVRLYPDDIAIETHEPFLTEEEAEEADLYWKRREAAKKLAGEEGWAECEAAWRELVDRFGVHRAAYIVQLGKGYQKQPQRPESWSEAPRSRVMPDFFVVRLYREKAVTANGGPDVFEEHELVHQKRGKPIRHPLITGPDPFVPTNDAADGGGQASEALLFDEESEWLIDFEKAVANGMALKIALKDGDLEAGFSRVIALGIKATADAEEGKSILKNLIEGHTYSEGFSFLKPGTPTNNTGQAESGFSRKDEEITPAFEAAYLGTSQTNGGDATDATPKEDSDALRMADYLGIPGDVFNYVRHADLTGDVDARHMQHALWPATWCYYLNDMLSGMVSKADIENTRQHYVDYVRANGPLPVICVEDMPYGILPVSSLSRWQLAEDEEQGAYLSQLQTVLKKLYKKWHQMAKDPALVPRVGASDDPDQELIGILGMEGGSNAYRVRPFASKEYVRLLLKFLQRKLLPILSAPPGLLKERPGYQPFRPDLSHPGSLAGWLWGALGGEDPSQEWDQALSAVLDKSAGLLKELGEYTNRPLILEAVPWGDGYEGDIPLVQSGPRPGEDPLTVNYIETLKTCNYNHILNEEWNGEPPPETLLFCLLRLAILLSEEPSTPPNRDYLGHLAALPASRLECLLTETLDLSTHRLDAWITSLVTRRLQTLRADNDAKQGIYLGAYGWVENLKPAGSRAASGGFIQAPSIPHAVTAAVLRNAHLTHMRSDDPDLMSVDLPSERVRQALWLLEGIQQGQPLGALLGYRFERSLHETRYDRAGNELYLDRYIQPFRELYPLTVEETDDTPEDASVEAVAARNVVDGLELVNRFRNNTIPFGSGKSGLPSPRTPDFEALNRELEATSDCLDALSDLALAESVYHSVTSNYLRAGALLDAISGDTGSAIEVDVARTPRSAFKFKHHVLVLFSGNAPADSPPSSPRCQAEPHLNAWAGKMLGEQDKVACRAWYPDPAASDGTSTDVHVPVYLINLELSPLDFVYLSTSPASGEATELEQRIKYFVQEEIRLTKDTHIRLHFDRSEEFTSDTTFPEILELGRRILDVIGNAKYLSPVDLHLPEEAEGTNAASFSENDFDDLKERIIGNPSQGTGSKSPYGKLKAAKEGLDAARLVDDCDKIRSELMKASQFGISGSIPTSAIETDAESLKELKDQAGSVSQEIRKRLGQCDEFLNEADAAKDLAVKHGNEKHPDLAAEKFRIAIGHLSEASQAIFGKSFAILPRFTPQNANELSQVLQQSNTPTFLGGESKIPITTWFQGAAQTHPQLKRFETMMMLAEAYNPEFRFDLSAGQLPYRPDDRWLALPFEANDEREILQGTVSLVTNMPFGYQADGKLAGLVLDKWDEGIPSETETTGIVYQYDRPGSEAPQSLLLAVSPEVKKQNGRWKWEHLVKCVEETLDLAKIRAVDPDALKEVGQFLPALYMPGIELGDGNATQMPIACSESEGSR